MLKKNPKRAVKVRQSGLFAIVASRYNARYVDSMVRAAQRTLRRAGAKVRVFRVPGAYEIPVIAARLAAEFGDELQAIICLGVILRGETVHAQHIGEAVSQGLMQIQLRYRLPVIHEVLLLENPEQAAARCLSREQNRGEEAARTALEMGSLMRGFSHLAGGG